MARRDLAAASPQNAPKDQLAARRARAGFRLLLSDLRATPIRVDELAAEFVPLRKRARRNLYLRSQIPERKRRPEWPVGLPAPRPLLR